MKKLPLITFPRTVISLLVAISSISSQSYSTEFSCNVPIASFSDRAKVASGELSANVTWQEVELGKNSIGYGPGEYKSYELTIVDGQVFMSKPADNDGGVLVRTDPKPNEGAFMLQVATPESWSLYTSMQSINSLTALSQKISKSFDELGCKGDDVLAFKIKGQADSLSWSMDTKVRKVIDSVDEEIEIIGLFSKTNIKKYFLLSKYNLHPHVVLKSTTGAGHLRKVVLQRGANLYLPSKS